MRRAVGIALEGDGGNRDHRELGEPSFEAVVLRLAFDKTEPPTVVVNDDGDVVRIVEGRCAAIEGGVVEGLLR
jgi:hypothetical protein